MFLCTGCMYQKMYFNRYAMFLQFILFCIKIYRFPKTTCTYDNIEALGFLYEAFNAVSKFSFMLLYISNAVK